VRPSRPRPIRASCLGRVRCKEPRNECRECQGSYPNCCAKNGTQIEQAFDRAAGGPPQFGCDPCRPITSVIGESTNIQLRAACGAAADREAGWPAWKEGSGRWLRASDAPGPSCPMSTKRAIRRPPKREGLPRRPSRTPVVGLAIEPDAIREPDRDAPRTRSRRTTAAGPSAHRRRCHSPCLSENQEFSPRVCSMGWPTTTCLWPALRCRPQLRRPGRLPRQRSRGRRQG
jgi:hypothetical protein